MKLRKEDIYSKIDIKDGLWTYLDQIIKWSVNTHVKWNAIMSINENVRINIATDATLSRLWLDIKRIQESL